MPKKTFTDNLQVLGIQSQTVLDSLFMLLPDVSDTTRGEFMEVLQTISTEALKTMMDNQDNWFTDLADQLKGI